MSMVLMLYSLGNLHVVSWGTRENKQPGGGNTQQEYEHNNITVFFFSLYEFWCLFKEVYIFARQMGVSAVLTHMKKICLTYPISACGKEKMNRISAVLTRMKQIYFTYTVPTLWVGKQSTATCL